MARKSHQQRFIPFDKSGSKPFQAELVKEEISKEIISKLSLSISIESAKLLEITSKEDYKIEDAAVLAASIQKNIELVNQECNKQKTLSKLIHRPTIFSGTTSMEHYFQQSTDHLYQQIDDVNKNRVLENGGMAPPTNQWQSISNVKLNSLDKFQIVQEMRKMNLQGKTITKSHFHDKPYTTIKEFTEPFKFLENTKDYSGSFLISLLKDELEIDNNASIFKVDLSQEKAKCLNGDLILVSVYDIAGSSTIEEKKFLLVIAFDKLNGTLKMSSSIFMEGQNKKLSERQIREIEKFCRIKKIEI